MNFSPQLSKMALQPFDPDPHTVYTIETAAHFSQMSRRMVLVCCKHGLISPTAGQVLHPGQNVKVQWTSVLPHMDLNGCEAEVWLSLDGGRTFTMCITPILDPKAQFFYWTVPNVASNAAVLDIRFGCEGWYPESFAPQPGSTFVIAKTAASH